MREKQKTFERINPIELFAVSFKLILMLFGAGYLAGSESFGQDELTGRHYSAALYKHGVSSKKEDTLSGKTLYVKNCATCHKERGQGVKGVFPPLDGSEWVLDDGRIIAHIMVYGIEGDLEVKGELFNGYMPSFAYLSDEELTSIANFVRNSWTNRATPLREGTISQARITKHDGPINGSKELHRLLRILDAPR